MRKAKKMIAKSKRKLAKKNKDTQFLRAVTNFNAIPTQGVTVANYVYGFLGLVQNWPAGVLQNVEYCLLASQYDKVRINSMRVTITPKANVLDQGNAQNDAALNLSGDGSYHSIVDRNGPCTSSISAMMKYGSYRKTSVLKRTTRVYSVTYPKNMWLNTASSTAAFLADPGNAALINQLGLNGGVTYYAENLLEDNLELFNEPWAAIKIEYNCVFQGRTGAGIKANNDGSFTIMPFRDLTPAAYSPAIGFQGTLADEDVVVDLSGNIVPQSKQWNDTSP